MKSKITNALSTLLLVCTSFFAFSQVDIRIYQLGNYVSKDTMLVNINADEDDADVKTVFFNIYNLSTTTAEALYVESDMQCSNSSAFYQFCQEYPPTYNVGNCHTFHHEGTRIYDGNGFLIPPDTCSYNYLRCHFFIHRYTEEQQHEKVYRFFVKREQTHEILDSMYMIIRRGNKPCSASVSINTLSADDVVSVYPNPASNILTVAAKQDQLTSCFLFAPDGKMVFNKSVNDKENISVNVGDLSSGIYYLKVTDKHGGSFYKKIVVAN